MCQELQSVRKCAALQLHLDNVERRLMEARKDLELVGNLATECHHLRAGIRITYEQYVTSVEERIQDLESTIQDLKSEKALRQIRIDEAIERKN